MSIIIVPTKRCDLRCRHCMRDTFSGDHLDLGVFHKFMRDIDELGNNKFHLYSLTGGEPTIHPELTEMLKGFGRYDLKTHIVTNGQRMEGVEQAIAGKKYLRSVAVSFDSPYAELNDQTRGKGAFKKAVEAVKEYRKNGVPTHISFVLHDDNAHTVEDCFKLGERLNIQHLGIWSYQQWVATTSNGSKYKADRYTEDMGWSDTTGCMLKTDRHRDIQLKYQKSFNSGLSDRFEKHNTSPIWPSDYQCPNKPDANNPLETRIVLLPDGKISLCCDLYDVDYDHTKFESHFEEEPISDILGDYTTQSLREILEQKAKNFVQLEHRRKRDAMLGLLTNGRENVCTNCAYYHHQKPKSQQERKPFPISVVAG